MPDKKPVLNPTSQPGLHGCALRQQHKIIPQLASLPPNQPVPTNPPQPKILQPRITNRPHLLLHKNLPNE
jgi:hypothetical protein